MKNSRKMKCKICRSTFFDKSTLQKHTTRVHLKSQSYKCNYCGSTFFNQPVLEKHLKIIHTKCEQKKNKNVPINKVRGCSQTTSAILLRGSLEIQ